MFCAIHGYGCNGMCTQQNMAAQQQLSNQLAQHYNQLLGGALVHSNQQEKRHSIPEPKKPNKLLLLLR